MTRVLSLRRIAQNTVAKDLPGVRPLINLDTVESGTGRLIPGISPAVAVADQNLAAGPGVVLFAKLRPYLRKSFIPSGPVFVSSEFLCLTPLGGIDPRWLMWSTLSDVWVEHAVASTYGSKMPRTSWGEMSTLRLSVPIKEQQRRIADFLDDQVTRIDQAISLREHQKALFMESRDSLQAHRLDQIAQAAGWITLRRLSFGVEQGWSPTCESGPADPGDPGVLKLGSVRHGAFFPRENKAFTPTIEPDEKWLVRDGDLLVSRANTPSLVGESTVVQNVSTYRLYLCDLLYRILLRPSINPHFVSAALRTRRVRDWCRVQARGTSDSMVKLRGEDVLGLPIPRADVAEMKEVGESSQRSMQNQQALDRAWERSLQLLKERKAALITAAVTGEFDVTTAGPRAAAAVTG
jgi:type I restriction enzyme, S subunit